MNSIELMLSLSGSGKSRLKEGASAMGKRSMEIDGATFRDGPASRTPATGKFPMTATPLQRSDGHLPR